jgi:tripartite-type tricarboxylate transporter receptor subunit TctC
MLRRSLFAAPAVLLVSRAMAQSRTTRLVVAFPPGGTADILARTLAEAMRPLLGETIVVENRPGAGTAIATEIVVRAPADGRTLLVGGVSQIVNQALKKDSLRFDFARDLAPVGQFATMPTVVIAGSDVGEKTLADAITAMRRAPGTYAYGSSGTGTSSHLAGMLFARLAGAELLHVPHRGAAAAFSDLMSGRLQFMFPNVPESLGHLSGGRLRALAIAAQSRSTALPDVPTAAEAGLAGFDLPVWLGLMAPSATPAPELERLSAALAQALASDAVRARWTSLGAEPGEQGRAALERLIAADMPRWSALVAASGATID